MHNQFYAPDALAPVRNNTQHPLKCRRLVGLIEKKKKDYTPAKNRTALVQARAIGRTTLRVSSKQRGEAGGQFLDSTLHTHVLAASGTRYNIYTCHTVQFYAYFRFRDEHVRFNLLQHPSEILSRHNSKPKSIYVPLVLKRVTTLGTRHVCLDNGEPQQDN